MFHVLISLLVVAAASSADPAREAAERGRLSLAWDARESGLCEEALAYLRDIQADSPAAAEALQLKVDCLWELRRYPDAVGLLEPQAELGTPDRPDLLRALYWDWASELTEGEHYREVIALAGRALAALPGDPTLEALRAVAHFREDLRRCLLGPARICRLRDGAEVAARPNGGTPGGKGWIQAYPWRGETPWVPQITVPDWMPSLGKRIQTPGGRLWFRFSAGALKEAVQGEAKKKGLGVRSVEGGLTLSLGQEEAHWGEAEWVFRAASEGLGIRGAALQSAAEAAEELSGRAALLRWVTENRAELELQRMGETLRLRNPRTGRTHTLDIASWSSVFQRELKEWKTFWADVVAELGRPAAPFRCFCGQEATLREGFLAEAPTGEDAPVVLEKEPGYSLLLLALCPQHQQYVTEALLREWGVSAQVAWERARAEAVAKAWDVAFERGEESGMPYVVLEAEGIPSLVRRPELLLAALEAVEGSEVRGTAVSIRIPTTTSLLVLRADTPRETARAAEVQVLLRQARRGDTVERLGYQRALRLPNAGTGVFRVRPME